MCSSPHWQVGQSWVREKLSPANRKHRLSRWADFTKNCLPRIGCYRDYAKNIAPLGAKKWGPTCDRDISNSVIYTTAIYREYTVYVTQHQWVKGAKKQPANPILAFKVLEISFNKLLFCNIPSASQFLLCSPAEPLRPSSRRSWEQKNNVSSESS